MSPWRSSRPDGRSASRWTSRSPDWARISGPVRRRAMQGPTLHLGDLARGHSGIRDPAMAATPSTTTSVAPTVDPLALRALLDGEHAEIRDLCRAWLDLPTSAPRPDLPLEEHR